MTFRNKLFSLMYAALFCLSSAVSVFASAADIQCRLCADEVCITEKFTDLEYNLWYQEGIHFCMESSLMSGKSANEFAPSDPVTRGEIATILWRLAGSPAMEEITQFSDVPADMYCAESAVWAFESGIMRTGDDTLFAPLQYVTREQIATILWRYAAHCGYDTEEENTNILSYADAFDISDYAYPALQWIIGAGIMSGTDAGTIEPAGTTTRAQIAVLLMRYDNFISGKANTLPASYSFLPDG